MGHGGGTATAVGRRFGKFGDFGLRMERNVAGNFGKSAAADPEGGGGLGEAIAVGVPGSGRNAEEQIFGEGFGHCGAICTESSDSADGASKLQSENAGANLQETYTIAENGIEPAGDNEAKGGRKCLLHPSACDDGGVTMSFGKAGKSLAKEEKVAIDKFEGAAELQNGGGIDSVLAG